jgi:hemolysin III
MLPPTPDADDTDRVDRADFPPGWPEPAAPAAGTSFVADERHRLWKASQAARPLLRGWLHAAALPLVAAGGTALTLRVRDRKAKVGLFVFGGGYSAMLAASASYHRLPRSERQAHWLRRVDHSMIYVAEAATVTPLAVMLLPAPLSGIVIGSAWTAAGVGAALKMTRLNEERDGGSWLYLAIGWAGVVMAPLVYERGGREALAAMAVGGLLYSGGFAVLATQRPDPAPGVFGYHEVWHALVLAAGLAHAEMLRRIVVGTRVGQPVGSRR